MLRKSPNVDPLGQILDSDSFCTICTHILSVKGEKDAMTIAFLKNIFFLLELFGRGI